EAKAGARRMGEKIEMGEHLQEGWLEARLREEMPYVDDAGFTARVVQLLPVKRASSRLRAAILFIAAALASVLAFSISDGGRFVLDGVVRLSALSLFSIYLLALGCGIVGTIVAGTAALSRVRHSS
ncbi:MAG: hypothetical protein ABI871_06980, partial [Chthoniobacterales bacterium]